MDQELKKIAQSGLDRYMAEHGADLLTCFFFNPFSENYWLFHRQHRDSRTRFYYEEQLYGPLTHGDQEARMGPRDESQIAAFDYSDRKAHPKLRGDILNGRSFVNRERINKCIRITLVGTPPQDAPSRSRAQDGPSTEKSVVVIFLNYRRPAAAIDQKDGIFKPLFEKRGHASVARVRERQILEALALLRDCLFTLATEPLLDPMAAWRLRSMSLRKQKAFSGMLITDFERPSKPRAGQKYFRLPGKVWMCEKERKHWDLIARQARDLIHPDDKRACLVYQLYEVDRDGELSRIAGTPDKKERDHGVCYYVAEAGQIFLIQDAHAYEKKVQKRKRKDVSVLPDFVRIAGTRSELACPLIVQGKVVGVLNLESSTLGRYGEDEALLLYLFANSVALSLRQAVLFRDLLVATTLQHQLVCLHSEGEDDILARTVKAVNDLGYDAGIWRFDDAAPERGFWIPGSKRISDMVRIEGGHTLWIRENREPIVIANYRPKMPSLRCEKKKGVLNQEGLFERWRETPDDTDFHAIRPNPAISKLAGPRRLIVTDFGFPVFEDQSRKKVAAVLWAKCYRHFESVLDEESWFLSSICRSVSEACRAVRASTPRDTSEIQI